MENYGLLLTAGLGIIISIIVFNSKAYIFKHIEIKKDSFLRKIPLVRKLVEKEPYYVRVLPVIFSWIVLGIVFIIYIFFWIDSSFFSIILSSIWVNLFEVVYIISLLLFIL